MSRKNNIITQVTAEAKAGKAYIRIVDYIAEWGTASSTSIREKVDQFLKDGVKECDVYINSRGGSVFEAVEISNDLGRFNSVSITIGSLAASAATYITSKFPTSAKPNTQFMIHRPMMGTYGNVATIKADIKLLENATEDYKQTYAAKTGKTPEDIETLWADGDVWMTAKEAKDAGFIDSVEGQEQEITEAEAVILEACGAPIKPDINSQNKNSTTMDRLKLIAALGLAADASDEQIEAALQANKKKADQLEAIQASEKDTAETRADKLVAQGVKDKKFGADQSAHYKKLAVADYDTTAALIASMQAIPALSAHITTGGKTGTGEPEARKNWTLEDYLAKAPDAYAKMRDEEPERAQALEDAYFNEDQA